jgi:hypothetical protein
MSGVRLTSMAHPFSEWKIQHRITVQYTTYEMLAVQDRT